MAEDTKHKVPQGLGTGTTRTIRPQVLGELGGGVYGAFHPNDPSVENLAEQAYGVDKLKTNKTDLGSRLRNAGVDMGFQTATDPLTYVGGKLAEVGVHVAKPVLAAAVRGVGPLGKYVTEVRAALSDPALAPAIGKVTHAVRTATAPLRGGVNATKDLLFMNPLVHGVGNVGANNFLTNGAPTAAKGLWYGLRGAPQASVDALKGMGAGAYTPELLGDPSPWGPVGWMSALGKKGVPAAVRAVGGGAAGTAIANQTAPSTDTGPQRLARDTEGAILGVLGGASPEVLNASNKIMSRLEMGHRAAMFEGLPKPIAAAAQAIPKVAKAAIPKNMEQTVIKLVQNKELPTEVQQKIFTYLKGNPGLTQAQKNKYLAGVLQQAGKLPQIATKAAKAAKPVAAVDPRAAQINAIFGGGDKGPLAKVATALGGPYAQWQGEIVPRVVGGALRNAPARVEAIARGQDITNRDILKDKPYKLQVGGPIGDAAELAANPQKYGSRLLGPIGQILSPGDATSPQTFSAGDRIKSAAYEGTPGRQVVGPFFGDTMYPSKAPAIPSAALSTLLGWHFANKTPRQDAILSIMKASGLDATQAASVYDRYKK